MGFVTLFSSTFGRWLRIVVGLVLVIASLTWGPVGAIFFFLGLVLISVGASDTCLLAPLFGRGFNGNESRRS
jgi:general stress protein CsbA